MFNRTTLTRLLLGAGVLAGTVTPVVIVIDGSTRGGYSLWRNGVSQLGTGERAGLFTATFVVCGLLLVLFALGLRKILVSGRGAIGAPIMIIVAAIGYVVGGFVPTDPALGYPSEATGPISTAGAIHQVAGLMIFAGLAAAAFVLARRLREQGRGWAIYSRLTGALIIVFAFAAGIAYRLDTLGIWRPAAAGLLEQISLLIGYGWLVAVAVLYLSRPASGKTRPAS
jgi:hypothetical protein